METLVKEPTSQRAKVIIICQNCEAYTASTNKLIKNFNFLEFPIQVNQSKTLYPKDIVVIFLLKPSTNEIEFWRKGKFYKFNASHEEESDFEEIFQQAKAYQRKKMIKNED